MNKIAAVVVTYNRKDCLINCLNAIRLQTLPPDIMYIIDNHSTDGTAY
jgi:GT2 family glycosyltransferase